MKKLFCAAAALALLTAFAGSASAVTDIDLWIDVDGTAYLRNNTAGPLSFDGYQIASESKALDPAGWDSISDRIPARINDLIGALGAGALTFGEANPGEGNLAEVNLGGAGTLAAGAKFSLGHPFKTGVDPTGQDFFFKLTSGTAGIPGDITVVHEPSTFVLAGLGLVGVAGLARRRRAA